MSELQVDPDRPEEVFGETGIYVRAQTPEGEWVSADIVQLTKDSLIEWLESREKTAVQTLLILLGHTP